MNENNHADRIHAARDRVRQEIRDALRLSDDAICRRIMTAVDALILAERDADRRQWRNETYQDRAHERAVTAAHDKTRQFQQEARKLRPAPTLEEQEAHPGQRRCTRCGVWRDAATGFYHSTNRATRPHCKECEKESDRQRRKAAAAARAARFSA